MRYVRILVLLMVSTVAIASMTSCSKEQKLLGTWSGKVDGMNVSFTFANGGGGTVTSQLEGTTVTGTITWSLEKSDVTIIAKLIGEKGRFHGTFDGETLIIEGVTFTKKK